MTLKLGVGFRAWAAHPHPDQIWVPPGSSIEGDMAYWIISSREMCETAVQYWFSSWICFTEVYSDFLNSSIYPLLKHIHTLRVHYAHAAPNLNSGYSKYAKVARVHYFCTIALRTYRAVLTRTWASRRVD